MYKQQLRVHGEYFAKEQAVPANTTAEGNEGSRRAGSMLGAAELVVAAAEAVTIGNGKKLIVELSGSDDDATFATLPVRFEKVASNGAMNFATGEVMARLPLASDTSAFVKVVMGTDDAAASGKVDAFFEYLPR